MEILEQYVQAVAHITVAVGQPFLLATENGRALVWGGPRTTWQVPLAWADTEYLATIAKVDRVVGAMLRLNIPCDVTASRRPVRNTPSHPPLICWSLIYMCATLWR